MQNTSGPTKVNKSSGGCVRLLWFSNRVSLYSPRTLYVETRLALNSKRSTCLWLPWAGIKGVCHDAPLKSCVLKMNVNEVLAVGLSVVRNLPWGVAEALGLGNLG